MFRIELLPAHHGDCLWIEYGSSKSPKRILIDGGTEGTHGALQKRLDAVGGPVTFELIVVTHVDADHIAGMLKLLEKNSASLRWKDFWFNSYEDLAKAAGKLGPEQGDRLSSILDKQPKWNEPFSR